MANEDEAARYVRTVVKRYPWFRETALSIIDEELTRVVLTPQKKAHLIDLKHRIESKDLAASIAAIAEMCATAKSLDLPPEMWLKLLVAAETS
jgi:hypothetical protein